MKETYRDAAGGPDDLSVVLGLFEQAFHKPLSPAFWRWRFVDNPAGPGRIRLLWDGSTLVGHYAAIPMDLELAGRPLRALFSMTTMTHPAYAGQGIFPHLASQLYDQAAREGFRLVYGFPNKNSRHSFTAKLGWRDLGVQSALEGPTGALPSSGAREARIEVAPATRFGPDADALWARIRDAHGVAVTRSSRYMNWRFVAHPEARYHCLFARGSGGLCGYAVLKLYDAPDGRVGHIVDLVSETSEEVATALLAEGRRWFAAAGAERITSWFADGTLPAKALGSMGFRRVPSETAFGYRRLDASRDAAALDHASWTVTMGDSDVF